MPESYAFRVTGVEPRDAEWRRAPESLRREFWKAVVAIGLVVKDKELAQGLDRRGDPMTPISAYTRAHRRSAMGWPDPNAPPLIPAHGLSRTRSLLHGRAGKDYAEFFWKFDAVTGRHWGKILGYHRAGAGRLPKRDVIGISPRSLTEIRHQALIWWDFRKRGIVLAQAVRDFQLPTPTPTMPAKIPVVGRTDFGNFTFGIGGDLRLAERASEAGFFTGFRQFHPDGGMSAPRGVPPAKPPGAKVHRAHPVPPPPNRPKPERRPPVPVPVTPTVPSIAGVEFTPSRAAKAQRMATVVVDVAKLDAAFQRDKGFAIGPAGEGAIAGRIPGFVAFLAKALAEGTPIEQSQIVVKADGSVSFIDGRHRFSVLRDMGLRQIPVSVPRSQADRARKFFGATAPTQPAPVTAPKPKATPKPKPKQVVVPPPPLPPPPPVVVPPPKPIAPPPPPAPAPKPAPPPPPAQPDLATLYAARVDAEIAKLTDAFVAATRKEMAAPNAQAADEAKAEKAAIVERGQRFEAWKKNVKTNPNLIPPFDVQERLEIYARRGGAEKLKRVQDLRQGTPDLKVKIDRMEAQLRALEAAYKAAPKRSESGERDRIEAEYEETLREVKKLEARGVATPPIDKVLEAIRPGKTMKITSQIGDPKAIYKDVETVGLRQIQAIAGGLDVLRQVVSEAGQPAMEVKFGRAVTQAAGRTVASSFCTDGGIALSDDASPVTVVHEFGHYLEGHTGAGEAARDFLAYRVGSEQPTRMADVFPGVGYGPDETGRKDRFEEVFGPQAAYYVGKKYRRATEITSMGLEKFLTDPIGFAETDPEFVSFLLGVLDGSLR